MAVSAIVKDGQLVETTSQTATGSTAASATVSEKNGYDKDAFMQILVAQMKYQDPLAPTSNTEYINQYATFSQVEQLQNMAQTMDLSRASSYVGQTVQISATDEKGNEKVVEGFVDFVKYESGKAFLSIDGDLYPADKVTAVIEPEYNAAFQMANAFADSMNRLPVLSNLTLADKDTVLYLESLYAAFTPYQQTFVDKSYVEMLKTYVDAIKGMIADSEAADKAKAEADAVTEDEAKTNEASEAAAVEESAEAAAPESSTEDSSSLSDEELDELLTDQDTV